MKIYHKKIRACNKRSIEKSKDDVDYLPSYAIPKHAGILLVLAVIVLTTSVCVRYWSVMMPREIMKIRPFGYSYYRYYLLLFVNDI